MRKSQQPQLTALALALTAVLATMVSSAAKADQTISGSNAAITISSGGADNITLTSTGIITGDMGINNSGVIGTLDNGGSISGASDGITNNINGTIVTLNNSGSISGNNGINQDGSIGTLTNSGSITSIYTAMNIAGGTIGALTNNSGGLINGGMAGIFSEGTITALTNNSGATISGTNTGSYAIRNNANNNGIAIGVIGTLTNNGLISGDYTLVNYGTIGNLINNSGGTITGTTYAIYNGGGASLGPITNAGKIAGYIWNDTAHDLTINGGTGSSFGTLTGLNGGIGTLRNTASDLTFGSGNQLLNDNVNVTGHSAINSAGTLQINNRIAITGNYSQAAAATLAIGVSDNAVTSTGAASDSGYGRLVVTGSANIAAGSNVALKQINSYGFAQGQRYLVVQAAAGGTNYNAGSLAYTAPGYTVTGASIVDGSNLDLLLTLGGVIVPPPIDAGGSAPTAPIDAGSPVSTKPINAATASNSTASLGGLFNYTGTDPKLMDLFNIAATQVSPASANRAGAQLNPAANIAAATQAATAPTTAVLNVIAVHMDSLRTPQAQANSGLSTGESARDVALWGQAFGGRANQGERDGVSGYSADYNGLLLGGDAMINDNWRVGGLFSYANTSVDDRDDNAGSSTHVNGYGLIGYAGYAGKDWYLDLSGGVVQQQYDTARSIDFGAFSGNAVGQHDARQYVASVQGGYPIKLDGLMANTTLTPIAGLSYSTLRQDGYTESGGNGAALNVGANNSSSLKSDLGAKLERTFATAYGPLVPSAQLSWRHEYRDTRLQSVVSFVGDTSGTTGFTTQGPSAVADTGVLALSATLMRSQNLKLSARYTLEEGAGYTAQTADMQLRYQF